MEDILKLLVALLRQNAGQIAPNFVARLIADVENFSALYAESKPEGALVRADSTEGVEKAARCLDEAVRRYEQKRKEQTDRLLKEREELLAVQAEAMSQQQFEERLLSEIFSRLVRLQQLTATVKFRNLPPKE